MSSSQRIRRKTYKFRAECIVDVMTWIVLAKPDSYRITKPVAGAMDVVVEYATSVAGGLIEPMRRVSDGHVMIESHALASKYTGRRNSELSDRYPERDTVVLSEVLS